MRQVARDAGVDQPAAPVPEHGGVDVGQHDMALGADEAGKCPGEVAGAAGQIEHRMTLADARLFDRAALPEPVQARPTSGRS